MTLTSTAREILVWGRERIGDVVVTFPALKLLRSHLPEARLTYVTSTYAEELVRISGLADRIVALRPGGLLLNLPRYLRLRREARSGRFGGIFLFEGVRAYGRWIGPLEGALRAARLDGLHAAERYARPVLEFLGLSGAPIPSPRLPVEDRPEISGRLASLGLAVPGDAYLVVYPGSYRTIRRGTRARHRKPDKRWPLEKFRQVVERVIEGFPLLKVVLVGARDERRWIEAEFRRAASRGGRLIDLAGLTGLREVLQLLSHAALLLSNDSGVMHLASVTGTPLVALFGPTDERVSGPFGMGEEARLLRAMPLEEARREPGCMDRIGVDAVCAEIECRLRRGLGPREPRAGGS